CTAELEYDRLGYELMCFFQTRLHDHAENEIERFESTVTAFPEVLECYYLTGEWDYLIKAVFRSRRDLERFLRNRLSTVPGISQIITSLVLSELKTDRSLPLL
ncbi:Lrp/AsnC family transcriptional regulator, partial [Desulfobacterales bacterium HSG16]|nr:Lrp/AsnC family transcriptional regulator [Desulfobacterales bacterium HSG16]